MIANVKELLKREISWSEEIPGGVQFYAYVEGDLCQLSMNDYPEERLFTLKWRDESVDFDDRPEFWKLPNKS